jgi:DNA-directed RNA polymerase specialized sigma24 family protein
MLITRTSVADGDAAPGSEFERIPSRGACRGGRPMNDVMHILSAIERGDPKAADQLLPLVYDERRPLAARRLAQQRRGQTLQPTALVHFAGLTLEQAAECLGISRRTANRAWRYARAWLYTAMGASDSGKNDSRVAPSSLRRRTEGW